ncbi:MAG: hypothetical protein WBA83_00045 [Burkholderiaceae bacterium]
MQSKSIINAAVVFLGLMASAPAMAQTAADERDFQQLGHTLKANDAERQSAIKTCTEQGIGDNPAAAAEFMGVPVERAAAVWCTRMTNGIANGQLTLTDIRGLNTGTVSARARRVLTTVSEGE